MSSTGNGVSIPNEAIVPVERLIDDVLGVGAGSGGFPAAAGNAAFTNELELLWFALTADNTDCVLTAVGSEVLSPPQPASDTIPATSTVAAIAPRLILSINKRFS